jgi:hypothetical protein
MKSLHGIKRLKRTSFATLISALQRRHRRRKIFGIDYATSRDYGAIVEGFVEDGVVTIEKITLEEPHEPDPITAEAIENLKNIRH